LELFSPPLLVQASRDKKQLLAKAAEIEDILNQVGKK